MTDLSCRLAGDVYVMSAEVEVPAGMDPEALRRDIEAAGADLGVDVAFRRAEAETL